MLCAFKVADRPEVSVIMDREVTDHASRAGSRGWLCGFDRQAC